jgi:hypothetical protein
MRIVSQDECNDINYDNSNIYLREQEDELPFPTSVTEYFLNESGHCILANNLLIGVYETKVRALEVMEEIRKAKYGYTEEDRMMGYQRLSSGKKHNPKNIFYMPKE